MRINNSALVKSIRGKFNDWPFAIELTNRCNLRCPLCGAGSGHNKGAKGMMRLESFKRFMDECSPVLDVVRFIGSGEPLLHPQFVNFVGYAAKKKQKYTICCTNGTVMKDAVGIVKSGLHEIHVDVDGLTGSQHRIYRVGSDLDGVLNNTRNLIETKKKLRSSHPEVYIDTLISKYNEDDYDRFIEFARSFGANGIRFLSINDAIFGTEDWFPTKERFQHKIIPGDHKCTFKNAIAGILSWDGKLYLCCMTPHHENPVIKLDAFKEKNLLQWKTQKPYSNYVTIVK